MGEVALLVAAWVLLTGLFLSVVYPAVGLPSPGPVPARTLIILLLAWYLIRLREQTWRDFGLTRERLGFVLGLILVLFVAKLLAAQGIDAIASSLALERMPAGSTLFSSLEGNVPMLLFWLVVVWVVGAFGEEMIFRGFIMHRTAALVGGTTLGWFFAVVVQSILFSVGHAYQGHYGMLATGGAALVYGLFYILAKKNLWPLIIVHGLWDTLGLVLIYLKGDTVL